MSTGFLAWHPDVHEQFGERLYFLLFALKSIPEPELVVKLKEVLGKYGVGTEKGREGYCSYEVLGAFDHLLRVWLPPHADARFMDDARVALSVESMLQFTVQEVVSDWRFDGRPDPSALAGLAPARVAEAQERPSEKMAKGFPKGVAKWVPANSPRSRATRPAEPIKAFICLKAPEKASDSLLLALQKRVARHILEAQGVDQRTIYKGVGFAWLLAKVVARDFHALTALVRGISNEFGEFGISTSTYPATHRFAEGDSIRDEALRVGKPSADGGSAEEQAKDFCPALDHHEKLIGEEGARLRNEVSRFIRDEVFPAELAEADAAAMSSLLEAALWDSEEEAMEALYLPTVRTERAVRERLLKLASQVDGNTKTLCRHLEERNQEVKRPDTIALGACLQGAQIYTAQCASNPAVQDFSQDQINRIARTRNRLMHGAALKLAEEWKELAAYLLSLFNARKLFVTALDECLNEVSKGNKK